MTDLTLDPNMTAPDDAYAALIAAHDGLTREESEALNARLILILMNHVGDPRVILQAIETAKR
ncbi:DUF2783 domain-containing protein [Roseicyclus mahoneyensis]|uniref:Uncharacterized protein DUF2783 n=1 Tax=Roseicyclus mahoneyensis TaxID=164332 RepID=A0A316G8X1_9RHOB|nr:DUF2783 domain-containing protein [Roseicyclus mahoneyensis]PWK57334.1 uncharacterized protein DUF2783 [Roseicyclus mahoneyensis]